MVEGLTNVMRNLSIDATTILYGIALKGLLRVNEGLREDLRSSIVGRVSRYGKLDSMALPELGLLPRQSREQAIEQINKALDIRRKITNG